MAKLRALSPSQMINVHLRDFLPPASLASSSLGDAHHGFYLAAVGFGNQFLLVKVLEQFGCLDNVRLGQFGVNPRTSRTGD